MKTIIKCIILFALVILLTGQISAQSSLSNNNPAGINQTVPSNQQGLQPNSNFPGNPPLTAPNTTFPPNSINTIPYSPSVGTPARPDVPNSTTKTTPGYPGTPQKPNTNTPNTPAQPGTAAPHPNTGNNNGPPQ